MTTDAHRDGHALGEGPGSIFVHARAPGGRAGERVAACGHPLDPGPARLSGSAAGAASFEALTEIEGSPACPECAAALGLALWAADAPAPLAPGASASPGKAGQARWAKIGALMVGGMMAAGTLARVLVYVVRR